MKVLERTNKMEGFNYKYYEEKAGDAWEAYDEASRGPKALLSYLDTIARSLACIADALEKQAETAGPKQCDYDAGLVDDE